MIINFNGYVKMTYDTDFKIMSMRYIIKNIS